MRLGRMRCREGKVEKERETRHMHLRGNEKECAGRSMGQEDDVRWGSGGVGEWYYCFFA